VLVDQNRTGDGIATDAGQPYETAVFDANALALMARYPVFGVSVVPDKQKCAGIVRLTRDQTPTASKVVFDTVFDPRFAVIGDLDARKRIRVPKATENNPGPVTAPLTLTSGKKCELESFIKRFGREI
jgi:hypothetical protein